MTEISKCPGSSNNCKSECRWLGCKDAGPFSSVDSLVVHVQDNHLPQFSESDFVVCLWQGCKVFNRPFEKKDWLPQHMRRHTNERPHKCFMNGCNMSFWNVHALQNHLQLHFKRCTAKQKKTVHKTSNHSLSPPSNSLLPLTAVNDSESPALSEETESVSSDSRKKSTRPKIHIPHNSNLNLAAIESSSRIPVPINGSIVHEDDINLHTLSVIKKSLLSHLLTGPQCKNESELRNTVCLRGKVVGRRRVIDMQEEYLIQWNPMIVPNSWVPVSDYTGRRIIGISNLKQCQKSALVQRKFLTTNVMGARHCRKRKNKMSLS